jgi:hypothetical protein
MPMPAETDVEQAPHVLTDAERRSILRRCLVSALRAGGYKELVEPSLSTD